MELDENAAKARLKKVKTLLVDLDGTLVVNRDIPLSVSFVYKMLGRLKKFGRLRVLRALRAVKEELKKPPVKETNFERSVEILGKKLHLPRASAEEILSQSVSEIFPRLERHFYPTPGARDFLDWAKDRFSFVLATNPVWKEEIIRWRLKWANVPQEFFSSITHSERMHSCKPLSSYYDEILSQEKLQPEEALLIGDTPAMDLPATRAGISVYLISTSQNEARYLGPRVNRAPAWTGNYPALRRLLEG